MSIPIDNIYYLLCYAWNKLREKEKVKVDAESRNSLPDLFARLMIQGTRVLLKRGIDRYYVDETNDYIGVKGKLEMGLTLKSRAWMQQRCVCSFDEFSDNILLNRIIVSTLFRLLGLKELERQIRTQIKDLIRMFSGIKPIELNHRLFKDIHLHRNNRAYGFLIHVCRIIYENTLPTERKGDWIFMDFTRDEKQMNILFEAFLLNFYKHHFPEWKVCSEYLDWQFFVPNDEHNKYLPRMKTDISITAKDRRIIMDAKYYRQTLSKHFEKFSIHSDNLYQLFSYLMNQQEGDLRNGSSTGILLYPTVDEEFNLCYRYQNHLIHIKTLNLNVHWMKVEERLKQIVSEAIV
jgi:5-methylcytosine-specific restriction enzyme subunit McrC